MKWWIAMFVGMCLHRGRDVLRCEKNLPGFDMRDESPIRNHTLIYTIGEYIHKKQLMEWFMDPTVAVMDKIRVLKPEISGSRIVRGGLMDSWEWDES